MKLKFEVLISKFCGLLREDTDKSRFCKVFLGPQQDQLFQFQRPTTVLCSTFQGPHVSIFWFLQSPSSGLLGFWFPFFLFFLRVPLGSHQGSRSQFSGFCRIPLGSHQGTRFPVFCAVLQGFYQGPRPQFFGFLQGSAWVLLGSWVLVFRYANFSVTVIS